MLKLGPLELGEIPRIAVGFTDTAREPLILKSKAHGLDIAEVRIDLFKRTDPEYVRLALRRFSSIPTIATIRSAQEGGGWVGDDDDRLDLFRAALPLVDAIDIELRSTAAIDCVREMAQRANKCLLVSYHDFAATPDPYTLDQIADDAEKAGADIVKIATHASSDEDIQSLASFSIGNVHRNLIVIAMGSHGLKSRLFFPALGSLITYACIGEPTAPGQLEFRETFDLMRSLYPAFNEIKIAELGLLEGS
jgi:3-dehydroquinate dehydratase type I